MKYIIYSDTVTVQHMRTPMMTQSTAGQWMMTTWCLLLPVSPA